jgi:phage portal protein BeeE
MLLAEARFCFQALSDKGIYGRPELKILEKPWPGATSGEMIARAEQDISLAGNSFMWKTDSQLVRLPPDEVTIVSRVFRDTSGRRYRKVIGYDWDPTTTNLPGIGPGRGDDPPQHFTVDEVAHWSPYPDPQAHWRGMSWLTPIMRDVDADSGLTAYKAEYLDHAATPNMVIQHPLKLRPDTVDAIVARLQAKYGGIGNAFKTIILDQGATAVPVGSTFSQLDFSAVPGVGEDRICAAAGVDPVLVGLVTIGRSAVSYADAMRRLADITCRPLWRTMCASWEKLVPYTLPQGHRLWFDLSDVAALRQGEMERAQATQVKAAALVTLVQAGYTRESAVKAVDGDDISLLVEAPQPAPAAAAPSGGQPGVPRGPAGVTQVQTPASKLPAPSSFANLPSVNGNGAKSG